MVKSARPMGVDASYCMRIANPSQIFRRQQTKDMHIILLVGHREPRQKMYFIKFKEDIS
jgi:hypothetical protein